MEYGGDEYPQQLDDQFAKISLNADGSYEYQCEYPEEESFSESTYGRGFAYSQPGCWAQDGDLDSIVADLAPDQVRWMYKSEGDKRWQELSGHDSVRVERAYRRMFDQFESNGHLSSDPCAAEGPINVRGGMYEVDLQTWKCTSIYWPGEECLMTRGTWFYENTWQPLDAEPSAALEALHLRLFYGRRLADCQPDPASKTVLGTESFAHCHVDLVAPGTAFLYSEATPSKLVRSVTSRLGFHKSTGYRLYRGYKTRADESDAAEEVSHLVFVIHGIGHKMDQGRIIKNTTLLRECSDWLRQRPGAVPAPRAEFFPVEWRTNLTLDGDIVEAITPQKVLGLRQLLNSSAMDIMYYTSPLYGAEIQKGLADELNRLFAMFSLRNPSFVRRGGRVSLIAHSLGAVIAHDIITGYQLDLWRRPQEVGVSRLEFTIDSLFCLGSPLSVFLAMRGGSLEGQGHVLPPTLCNRLYNIFHPTDPVAYRMEPLLSRAYARVAPLTLQPYNATSRTPYDLLPLELIVSDTTTAAAAGPAGAAGVEDSPTGTPSRDRSWNLWGLVRASWKTSDGTASPPFDAQSTGLEHRLDYVLRETSIGVSYLSALTSHTIYWNNYDVAYFILSRLFPEMEAQEAIL